MSHTTSNSARPLPIRIPNHNQTVVRPGLITNHNQTVVRR